MPKLYLSLALALCLLPLALVSLRAQTSAPAVSSPAAEPDETTAMQGMHLTEAQAQALEQGLAQTPDNLDARARLLGYYQLKRFGSETAKKAYADQVLWIIAHRPEARFAGSPDMQLISGIDGDAHRQGLILWTAAVKAHPADVRILGNAASFLLLSDSKMAENLLLQAQSLEPTNPEWSSKLGELYTLSMIRLSSPLRAANARKALAEYERAYPLSAADEQDAMLPDLAKAAYEAGAYDKAQAYANSLVQGKGGGKEDWNYGNKIHTGNLILGRLALQNGNITAANQYLLAAGKTPGSPQLDSFGPNMLLAKELLAHGQRQTVLQYFQECRAFWSMGDTKLTDWTAQVKGGVVPDFGGSLSY